MWLSFGTWEGSWHWYLANEMTYLVAMESKHNSSDVVIDVYNRHGCVYLIFIHIGLGGWCGKCHNVSLYAIQFCFGAIDDDYKFNAYLKWHIILLAYYTCCRLYCNWYPIRGDKLSTVHASSGALPLTCTYDGCGWAGEPVTERNNSRFVN